MHKFVTKDGLGNGCISLEKREIGVPAANKETLSDENRWWKTSTHTTANEGSASDPHKQVVRTREQHIHQRFLSA